MTRLRARAARLSLFAKAARDVGRSRQRVPFLSVNPRAATAVDPELFSNATLWQYETYKR
jgi:hypothetical protein